MCLSNRVSSTAVKQNRHISFLKFDYFVNKLIGMHFLSLHTYAYCVDQKLQGGLLRT